MKIGFVGLGNMATAIIGGLLREGTTFSGEDGDATVITAANIIGSAKTEATRQKRAEQFGIAVTASNREVAEAADVLVLAVKPQFFPEVIAEIREVVNENTLVISIAAGLTLERIAALFNRDVTAMRLIRCMPNTPALVGAGIFGIQEDPELPETVFRTVLDLFGLLGSAVVLPEKKFNAFMALVGCGPAYVFHFMDALAEAGVTMGFTRQESLDLVTQLVLGSAKLAALPGSHPAILREQVCSPAGVTIAAINHLDRTAVRGHIIDAVLAAYAKS